MCYCFTPAPHMSVLCQVAVIPHFLSNNIIISYNLQGVTTTPGNLMEFEIAPGNTGNSCNLVEAPGKF